MPSIESLRAEYRAYTARYGEIEMIDINLFRSLRVHGQPPEVMGAKDASEYLRVDRISLISGAKTGTFPGQQRGKGVPWFFQRRDLDAFLKSGVVVWSLFDSEEEARAEERMEAWKAVMRNPEVTKRDTFIDRFSVRERTASKAPSHTVSRNPPPPALASSPSVGSPPAVAHRQADSETVSTVMIVSDVMTVADVAEYLKVSRPTVAKLAETGALGGRKIGTQWRFLRSKVSAYLEGS